MKKQHREHGTIDYIKDDDCDGRFDTMFIGIRLTEGCFQAFGGYVLNEFREQWTREICALFRVNKLDDMVGKQCWVLRSFSGRNESIEGLETMDGRRFTATDFFRRYLGKPVPSVLEKRRESIQSTIASLTRRINDETRTLAQLEADYVEWA